MASMVLSLPESEGFRTPTRLYGWVSLPIGAAAEWRFLASYAIYHFFGMVI